MKKFYIQLRHRLPPLEESLETLCFIFFRANGIQLDGSYFKGQFLGSSLVHRRILQQRLQFPAKIS